MRSIFGLLLIATALVGCSSVEPRAEPTPLAQTAQRQSEQGEHAGAAELWQQAAQQSRGAQASQSWLYAAQAWFAAKQRDRARAALANSNLRQLRGNDRLIHKVINAEFDFEDGRYQQILADIDPDAFDDAENLMPLARNLRSRALLALGNSFDAAAELSFVAAMGSPEQQSQTLTMINTIVKSLTDQSLIQGAGDLPEAHPFYAYAGRELTMRGLPLPRDYDSAAGINSLPPADADGYRPPERLAVLLPSSGPAAIPGDAVRDGLLSAFYKESRRKPMIHFYDTAELGAKAAYLRAIADGAGLIIGPLAREQVSEVFAIANPQVPILALNRSDIGPPPLSASYALNPEDEGIAAAKRALAKNRRSAMIILEYDENARRSADAFTKYMRENGGVVLVETTVDGGISDHSSNIELLSKQMNRAQVIYLAMRAKTAHLVMPQLVAAEMEQIPKLASSLILSGSGDARFDRDLDGIEYPDIPMTLGLFADIPEPEDLGREMHNATGASSRLFAMGYDAWTVATYLHAMRLNGMTIRGATGLLSLDQNGTVHRDPAWAVFSGGLPKPAPDGGLYLDAAPNR